MKAKKAISLILALVMALGCVQLSAFATGETPTGYSGASLPNGPDMTGETIDVTAANAQYVLDGAYGNINGKTINFTQNVTEVLDLARPTKYQGSGTTGLGSGSEPYSRTLENVTFTASDGVTLAGFYFRPGHIHAFDDYSKYNYVEDCAVTSTNDGYYRNSTLTNITFSGLTVTGTDTASPFYFIGSQENATVSGITFTGCTITSSNNSAINCNNNGTLGYGSITVENCVITANKIGVYINGVGSGEITLKNNSIFGDTNNAISIWDDSDAGNEGSVTVTGNYLKSNKYTVNLNNFASSQITFTGNAVVAGSRGHLGHYKGNANNNFWAAQGSTPDSNGTMSTTLTAPIADTEADAGENDITSNSSYDTAVVDTSAETWVTLSNTPEPAQHTVTFQLRDSVGDMTISYDSSVYTIHTQDGVQRSGAAVYNYMTQTVVNGAPATEPTGEPSYWYHSGKTFPVGDNTGISFTVEQSQAYVFDGWRLQGENVRYDFSTPVTSDITLVPHFSAVEAVFEINTEADLLAFAREVALGRSYRSKWGGFPRQTVKLMNNITLTSNWTPIPGNFRGIFDGNGYAISGLVINDTNNETGFFRTSGNGGSSFEIKNLTFQDPKVTSSGCHVGVLAGKMDSATVTDVTINNPTVLCTSTDNVGGLVGSVNNNVNDNLASASVFSGCSVNGGTISCTGTDGRMVGGLIGQAVRYLIVEDCSVSGVTINGYRKLGGLIGQANGTHLTCTDVSVSGVTLNAMGDTSYAKDLTMGGLVGQFATPTQSTITGTVSGITMTGPESIASGKNYIMGLVSGGTAGTVEAAETAMKGAKMTFDVTVSGTNTCTIKTPSNYEGIMGTPAVAAVAQIGETPYATLADAIAAVPDNGETATTITMTDDTTEASDTTITIAATKNIVLDLNGHTISSSATTQSARFIDNKGTLTVQDTSTNANGKITFSTSNVDQSYGKENITIYNIGGTLNLQSGMIENTSIGGATYAVNNSSNAWGEGDDKETVFNMTGGVVSAPNGDAALRVYQNCAQSANPFSHNTVTISGGTILDKGIFLDNYIYNPNVNTTGSGIQTSVTISGGTINGLIDLKLRHPFHTSLTITGGDFTNAKLWVRKHGEWNSVTPEPTSPIVTISGGKWSFVTGKAFGLEYDCDGTSWTSYTKPYSVSGGVFNVDLNNYTGIQFPEGKTGVANTDTTTSASYPYTVGNATNYVAMIGEQGYATLAAALEAAQDGDTIELLADSTGNVLWDVTSNSLKNKTITVSGNKTLTSTTENFGFYFGDYDSGNRPTSDKINMSGITMVKSGGNYTTLFDGVTANLNGVTIHGDKNSSLSYANGAVGTLTNVTVANTGYNNGSSMSWRDAALSVQGIGAGPSELTVKSGTYTSEHGYAVYIFSSGGTVNIEGGTFNGKLKADIDRSTYHEDYNKSIINISGGTFTNCEFRTSVTGASNNGTYAYYVITGGTFDADPSAYVAEGYTVTDNGDGTWTVSSTAVAQIGSTPYATLEAAVDAAQDGDTIKLLANVSTDVAIVVAANKNITLDLFGSDIIGNVNGKMLQNYGALIIDDSSTENIGHVYNTDTTAQGHDAVANYGTGVLTIKNGHFGDADDDQTNVNNVNRGAAVRNYGTALIEGGTFTDIDNGIISGGYAYALINEGTMTIAGGTVYGKMNGAVANNAGSLTVTGGSFDVHTGANSYYALWVTNDGDTSDVTISGGTFNGSQYGLYTSVDDDNQDVGNVKIHINGGMFSGGTKAAVALNSKNSERSFAMDITGGVFSTDPSTYVAEGYAAVQLTNENKGDLDNSYIGKFKVGPVSTTQSTSKDDLTETTGGGEVTYNVTTTVDDTDSNTNTLASETNTTLSVKGTTQDSSGAGANVYTGVQTDDVSKKAVGGAALSQIKDVETLSEIVSEAIKASSSDSTSVSSIQIVVVNDGVTAEDTNTITFEVHPEAIAYKTVETVTTAVGSTRISNEQLAENATFTITLNVDKKYDDNDMVSVTHKHADGSTENLGQFKVEGGKITITGIQSFSEFELVKLDNGSAGDIAFFWNLALEDVVDIKIFADFDSSVSDYGNYSYRYMYNSGAWSSPVAFTQDQTTITIASCAAKEMTVPARLQVLKNGAIIKDSEYTVKGYCDFVINQETSATYTANLKALCQNVLDYGSAAQTYFGYNTGAMANATHGTDWEVVNAQTIEEYTGSAEKVNVKSIAATVNLESRTGVVFYFTPANGHTAGEFSVSSVTIDDVSQNTSNYHGSVLDDGRYKVVVNGVSAYNLDQDVVVTLNDGTTMKYSPMTYAYRMRNDSDVGTLCKTLYRYWNGAKTYFG